MGRGDLFYSTFFSPPIISSLRTGLDPPPQLTGCVLLGQGTEDISCIFPVPGDTPHGPASQSKSTTRDLERRAGEGTLQWH